MATYFVSQGHDEIPRWQEAFPDARLIRPEDLKARLVRGDCVWVMADAPEWPEQVGELQRRGAAVGVMTYSPATAEAFQALESGARAYVHALSPPELLRQARLVILNQGIWVPPELMARVVGGVFHALGGSPRDRDEALAPLTERERAVALAVVEGYSNKEVARRLDITERTVKAHLGAVFRKLGVRDRMQLVLRLTSVPETALGVGRGS
ncbi:regulatory protein, luxR family [Halomonas shengliensis]|uniref:Regulatory protein, luxR family n=1 Tax=Halomonas shengliensis TaxID=419597 RepID=A0A1H0NJU2_9GAMM|nr:response regulator transcription factor [Halomonas shengliensis]SDO92974.1 regulatory protein, luxR family [Halomonas shengliensis]